jgi:hypothetical protein
VSSAVLISDSFPPAIVLQLLAAVKGARLFDLTNGWDDNHPIGAPVVVVTRNAPQDTTKWPHTTFVNGVSEGIAGARDDLRPPGRAVLVGSADVHRPGPVDYDAELRLHLTDVHEPVCYGPDVSAALDWVRGFACTSEVLNRLDPAAAARALERLREMLAAHMRTSGVWFGSRAWIITARRH